MSLVCVKLYTTHVSCVCSTVQAPGQTNNGVPTMSDFIPVAAQMVVGAVVQEVVGRTVSLVLGKRKDKASSSKGGGRGPREAQEGSQ